MPTFSSFAAFGQELRAAERDLSTSEGRRVTREMAEEAEKIAVAEARKDLGGDAKFSGWDGRDLADLRIKRGRKGGANDTSHWLFPTRKSGGPWKVAEIGRNKGNATGRGGAEIFVGPSINRQTGETFRTKTGKVRMTRSRKSGRWNGYTAGKGTASRADSVMQSRLPKVAQAGVKKALRKRFDVT